MAQYLVDVCGKEIKVQGSWLRIAQIHGDRHKFLDDPSPVLDALSVVRKRIDLFTFMQRLPETSPKYAYHMEWDNLAVLKVTTFENWWTHQIRSYPRNRARQAEKKGVVLREVPFNDALVQGIWRIYNESPVRQGRPYPHYGTNVERVHQLEATHLADSIFIGAYFGEELIGFAKLVADETRTQANFMNILSLIKHRDKAPTNALIAHAVKVCAQRHIPYLVYQKFSYGRRQDTLQNFKEVNGFGQIDLPRYYVPLTYKGRVALRLGLHRDRADRFHGPLFDRLREVRNAWYNRRVRSVGVAQSDVDGSTPA